MNKFKFFGSVMMAAVFALGLASCEKEDFKTDVDIDIPEVEIPDVNVPEGYKPGDAVLTIQPTVIAVIDGEIKNVTSESKITFNGKDKFEYALTPDKGIAAMEIEIEASYDVELDGETKTLTAKSTLSTPALSAGQVAVFTPTLVVSANSTPDQPGGEDPEDPDQPGGEDPEDPDQPGGEDPEDPDDPNKPDDEKPNQPGDEYEFTGFNVTEEEGQKYSHNYYATFENTSDYYFTNYSVKTKNEVVINGFTVNKKEVNPSYANEQELIDKIAGYTWQSSKQLEFKGVTIWARSLTKIYFSVMEQPKTITINANYKTRSINVPAAVLEVIDHYGVVYGKTETNLPLPGASHGHGEGHGHGHDHGHGYGNAGGGIVTSI